MRKRPMKTEATPVGMEYLHAKKELVDRLLDKYLPPVNKRPRLLHEAIRY